MGKEKELWEAQRKCIENNFKMLQETDKQIQLVKELHEEMIGSLISRVKKLEDDLEEIQLILNL